MGWFYNLFISKPKPYEVSKEVKDQFPDYFGPNKKGHDIYVKNYLGTIWDLAKTNNNERVYKLCLEGLPYLKPYALYVEKNYGWSETEMPPILFYGLKLAVKYNDLGFVNRAEAIINELPFLINRMYMITEAKERIAEEPYRVKLKAEILSFLKHNPEFPRSKLRQNFLDYNDNVFELSYSELVEVESIVPVKIKNRFYLNLK